MDRHYLADYGWLLRFVRVRAFQPAVHLVVRPTGYPFLSASQPRAFQRPSAAYNHLIDGSKFIWGRRHPGPK